MSNNQGSTILESIVAVSLMSVFVVIFGVTYTLVSTGQFLKHKNLAYYLAVEEIEALRQAPFSYLTDRTDADFIEVAYNLGSWQVAEHASAVSSPNTLKLNSPETITVGITGVSIIPGFEYDNFTLESEIYIDATSPSNWQAGFLTRYHDENNYFLTYFDSNGVYLFKKVAGVDTLIDSSVKSLSTNTWYKLKHVANGSSHEIFIDDVSEINTTDSSFAEGRLALLGKNSVQLFFDDVNVTTLSTDTWNFDSDEIGSLPSEWYRFGINDLPSGVTKLTIEDGEIGYDSIKKITARVEWSEKGKNKSIEIPALISQ
ncbi:MAG: hypothetical protein Q8P20_02880 [bacterium]|nr:hypothetical protein [bacterium]